MIARIWHGKVPAAKSAEYLRLMQAVARPRETAVPLSSVEPMARLRIS